MGNELQRYLGLFSITDATKDFSVAGNPLSLTAGDYYMSGVVGEDQLTGHMQTVIQALGAPYDSTRVTQSSTTGKVTISFPDAGNTAVTWTDAGLGTLLGFTGNLSGANEYLSTHQARYCWFPSRGLTSYPGNINDWWAPNSTTKLHRSANGQTYSRKGNILYDGRFEYKHLSSAEVWKEGSAWWGSFESFFEDVIHEGSPIRCFPDRTLNADSGDYETGIWQPEEGKPVSSMSSLTGRNIRDYNGYWRLELNLWKYVA
jgi:hypothetical protein